jgi:hypothetical protein
MNTQHEVRALVWFDQEVWDRDEMGRTWKIGFVCWDILPAMGCLPGLYKYCDDYGVEMVGTEIIASTTLDHTTNINRLVDAGADVIFYGGAAGGPFLKQMGELGVVGPLEEALETEGMVVPMFFSFGFTQTGFLVVPELADYAYGAMPTAPTWEEDTSARLQDIHAYNEKLYGERWGEEEGISSYRSGWNMGEITAEAIKRAVDEVGWANLTSEAVIEYGLKGFKMDPRGYSGDLSYDDYEGDRMAIEKIRMGKFDIDKWATVEVSGYIHMPVEYPQSMIYEYIPKTPHPGMYTG